MSEPFPDATLVEPDSGAAELPSEADASPPASEGDAGLDAGGGPSDGAISGDAAADSGAQPQPMSEYCGDAIRDPVLEECDDGDADDDDFCTGDCRVRDNGVLPANDGAAPNADRRLGGGAHPLAAGEAGFAVAYIEDADTTEVRLQRFDEGGTRLGSPLAIGDDSLPIVAADPAVAALPSGAFAVAWTGRSNGSPDIALRIVRGRSAADGPLLQVNEHTGGTQQDPDLIWTGSELVVAWTDGFEVRTRRLDASGEPLSEEVVLAGGAIIASNVALAQFGDDFAAAWRGREAGLERVYVEAGAEMWWTVEQSPSPSGDRPALLALDDAHLLLVYGVGTDPQATGSATVGRLRVALVQRGNPGLLSSDWLVPMLEPYASDATLAQRAPSAARAGAQLFVAWQAASPQGDSTGDEAFVQELIWDAQTAMLTFAEERSLRNAPAMGDQRRPVLVGSPLYPEGALIAAWEDRSGGRAGRPDADIFLLLRPTPFAELQDAATAMSE